MKTINDFTKEEIIEAIDRHINISFIEDDLRKFDKQKRIVRAGSRVNVHCKFLKTTMECIVARINSNSCCFIILDNGNRYFQPMAIDVDTVRDGFDVMLLVPQERRDKYTIEVIKQ